MKKITMLVSFLFLAITMVSCIESTKASSKIKKENLLKAEKRDNEISKGAPVLTLDEEVFDFGTVNEGFVVEKSFVVTNTGKTNLVITDAKATCGCTVPTWPKEAIEPGTSAEVKIKFNTSGKPNKQSKTVTLYTNTSKGIETITVSGMVMPKNKKQA